MRVKAFSDVWNQLFFSFFLLLDLRVVKFNMLFSAMNRRQVAILRDIVKDIEPSVFVLLTDVSDVMVYGFRSRNIDLAEKD